MLGLKLGLFPLWQKTAFWTEPLRLGDSQKCIWRLQCQQETPCPGLNISRISLLSYSLTNLPMGVLNHWSYLSGHSSKISDMTDGPFVLPSRHNDAPTDRKAQRLSSEVRITRISILIISYTNRVLSCPHTRVVWAGGARCSAENLWLMQIGRVWRWCYLIESWQIQYRKHKISKYPPRNFWRILHIGKKSVHFTLP